MGEENIYSHDELAPAEKLPSFPRVDVKFRSAQQYQSMLCKDM